MTTAILLVLGCHLISGQQEVRQAPAEPVDDRDIKVVSFVDLDYPRNAVVAVGSGVVVVEAALDSDGRVTSARALSGAGPLIEVCLSNISKWVFKPNRRQRVIVVYEFRHAWRGGCSPDRSLFVFRPPNMASLTMCRRPVQFNAPTDVSR